MALVHWQGVRSFFRSDGSVERTQVSYWAADSDALQALLADGIGLVYPEAVRAHVKARVRVHSNTIENGSILGGGLALIATYVSEDQSSGVAIEVENRL